MSSLIDVEKEAALGEKVAFMRDAWVSAGKPEYEFWAAMMEMYTGPWPAAKVK